MRIPFDLGTSIVKWAETEPTVKALVLIGSRERSISEHVARADLYSDWDFHIITSNPQMFFDRLWTLKLEGVELRAYAARVAAIGGVPKVNAVFSGAEADFVIFPEKVARRMKFRAALGLYRGDGWTRRRFQDLALIIRPGWRFLLGSHTWGPFYEWAVAAVPDPRLGDESAIQSADTFVCDYVWTLRKIQRGELRAAQRLIFRELAETNYRLLHELKLRRGERTFPEARRIERITSPDELVAVTVDGSVEATSLYSALEKCAATCRRLMEGLVGDNWRWPELN
jgi:hypothetical protein